MTQAHRNTPVSLRVPATTANLGPGFDTLGMALSLWNHLRIDWAQRPEVVVHGLGADHLRIAETAADWTRAAPLPHTHITGTET